MSDINIILDEVVAWQVFSVVGYKPVPLYNDHFTRKEAEEYVAFHYEADKTTNTVSAYWVQLDLAGAVLPVSRCPWCGSEASVAYSAVRENSFVQCEGHSCQMTGPFYETKVGAVLAWNKIAGGNNE